MSVFSFLKSLIRHPRTLGTLSPASPFTAHRVGDAIPEGAKSILELGAGNGAITRELLSRLPSDGRLLAVELRPELAEELSAIGDTRLAVVRGDAREVRNMAAQHGFAAFDAAVSSLPFALFEESERDAILASVHGLLVPGGALVACQHVPTMLPELKRRFDVDTSFEPLNLPPYFVMKAIKAEKK
ncbi:hypothetical protein A2856_04230 [Candidatus Uhrbacteria bacterium RIFCSPHIGHO2_01_FULL_63_20]|uniref:Ribosomal RNA adenine methylase transferase N-terminal domain-containing protein n=1 Tax=Candidatus Uhrbacteria bacterium RIFCSPHIGHO2_01_FULL_63_20 TaxID=1802385 RepID=A0A1F7TMN2_9BACT|nr:MAG: hypothetical protein A2856_04230 [Candidatus Uhrbacteria bacterium RIFCSPHIGHO2_01_FULL_63_20]